eukprot:gene21344-7441_t
MKTSWASWLLVVFMSTVAAAKRDAPLATTTTTGMPGGMSTILTTTASNSPPPRSTLNTNQPSKGVDRTDVLREWLGSDSATCSAFGTIGLCGSSFFKFVCPESCNAAYTFADYRVDQNELVFNEFGFTTVSTTLPVGNGRVCAFERRIGTFLDNETVVTYGSGDTLTDVLKAGHVTLGRNQLGNTFTCSNAVFGKDPVLFVAKQCWCRNLQGAEKKPCADYALANGCNDAALCTWSASQEMCKTAPSPSPTTTDLSSSTTATTSTTTATSATMVATSDSSIAATTKTSSSTITATTRATSNTTGSMITPIRTHYASGRSDSCIYAKDGHFCDEKESLKD